jgi:hypothetical protein
MPSIEKVTGFMSGFKGALADVQQRKLADGQAQLQKSELAYAQQRRSIQDQRADTEWQQGQDDRAAKQSELQKAQQDKATALQKQAQKEGIGQMFDYIDAGGDPTAAGDKFSSIGTLKLKLSQNEDGTLTATGPEGGSHTGTSEQLRILFGVPRQKIEGVELNEGARYVNKQTGEEIANNPKPSTLTQINPENDLYETVNGVRKLVKKGVPKAGEGVGAGGQKVSTYNPQSHQEQAMKAAHDLYKKKQDELGNFEFVNPEDSERQGYADDLVTSWMSQKGAEGQAYGAGELGNLAFKASKAHMTAKEAGEAAVKAGNAAGSPGYNREVARLIRDSDVKAAQVWNDGIDAIEAKREAKEKAANGGKRPLKDILGE